MADEYRNPFYNPYSPNVDILGGAASTLRDMMQILLAKRQEDRKYEQQLWERGFAEKELKGQEEERKARAEYYRRMPTEKTEPEWQYRNTMIDGLVAAGKLTPEQGARAKAGLPVESPEERKEADKTFTNFLNMVKDGDRRITDRINTLNRPFTQAEQTMLFSMGKDAQSVLAQRDTQANNLSAAQAILRKVQSNMVTTNALPSQEDIAIVNEIYQNVKRVEGEGYPFKPPAEEPQAKKRIKKSVLLQSNPRAKIYRDSKTGKRYTVIDNEKYEIMEAL